MIDDTKRAKIGNAPMPSTHADLLCKAQQAQDEGQSEFAWNMSVHYPLLNMAVETSSYKGSFALRAAYVKSILTSWTNHSQDVTGHMHA